MRCDRCQGLMVVEDCLDVKGGKDGFWIKALRCVMCGNLLDPLIARHRIQRPAELVLLGRRGLRRAPRTPVARLTA